MHSSRLVPILLSGLLACGMNPEPGESPTAAASTATSDVPTIGAEEIAASGGATAWHVVDKLHRRWFRDQLSGKEVTVYEESQRVGGVDKLRDYAVRDVAELQYFDGPSAVRRWGPAVEGGVIVVVRNRT